MKSISEAMKAYMLTHPFDSGNSDCQTVLDQLYHAYAESHEHDPQEIGDGFKELEEYLCVLPLDNNNTFLHSKLRQSGAFLNDVFKCFVLKIELRMQLVSEICGWCQRML